MKIKLYMPLVAFIAIFSYSCDDFISPKLNNKTVMINGPSEGYVSTNYTITFWWSHVKGAEMYELQVVQPDFDNINQLFLDTLTTANKFSFTFAPGDYQWRIRAINNASSTDYVYSFFTIDSTLNLSSQTLTSLIPVNNSYKNNLSQVFSWGALSNATNYIFQLYDTMNIAVSTPQSTTTNYTSATFPSEGVYKWRVFAQNSVSSSPYAEHTITIDTTRPSLPIHVSPTTEEISADPIPLKWDLPLNAFQSHIQVSTDSTFATSSIDINIANTTNPQTYNLTSTTIGTWYYWRVYSIDKAGNKSTYFTKRRVKRKL